MYKWNDEDLKTLFIRRLEDAKRSGFTDEELSRLDLSFFTKETKSTRILYLIHLAFVLGTLRGIRDVDQSKAPISLREK